MEYAGKPSRYTPVTWTEMANGGRESPLLREQRSPEAGPRIRKCGHYAHAMPSTADTVYHVQAKHAEVSRARAIGKQKRIHEEIHTDQLQSAYVRDMRHLLHPTGWADEARMPEA